MRPTTTKLRNSAEKKLWSGAAVEMTSLLRQLYDADDSRENKGQECVDGGSLYADRLVESLRARCPSLWTRLLEFFEIGWTP